MRKRFGGADENVKSTFPNTIKKRCGGADENVLFQLGGNLVGGGRVEGVVESVSKTY